MVEWRQLARALVLGLTASALFLLLAQERTPGDGSGLISHMTRSVAGEGKFTFCMPFGPGRWHQPLVIALTRQ